MSDKREAVSIASGQPDPDKALPQPTISIILPTRNEAGNIEPLFSRLAQALSDRQIEIIVVDDSTDGTASLIEAIERRFPFPIKLIKRPPARRNGLSGAVVEGFEAASGRWLCVMDADLQHPPEVIPRLLARAKETGADIVVGSRTADLAGPQGLGRLRAFTSQILTILARMLFPRQLKNVSDPLTGLFLVSRARIEPAALNPQGFKILLEILIRYPGLHASEIHFAFGRRHAGASKADFHEGIRFFRHLLGLRLTANYHLYRFAVIILTGVLVFLAALVASTIWLRPHYLIATVVAAEILTLWHAYWSVHWVFVERRRRPASRLVGSLLFGQILIAAVHVPLVYWLVTYAGFQSVAANLVALVPVGLIRYALSEHWIWTRGLTMGGRPWFYYDLHGILGLASQVKLIELEHFHCNEPLAHADIQIRLDRHGTPSPVPGAIAYDEHLGRFGFGLMVKPGDFSEIVVSPLLERSPNFLFTNVVEPVLRWSLVRKGCALVKAAAVARNGHALLIAADAEMGQAVVLLGLSGWQFQADDRVLLERTGRVWCYPKPLTVSPEMAHSVDASDFRQARRRLSLRLRNLLYSRAVRGLGLWLSGRKVPAATFNTYLQWLIPQPKHLMRQILPQVGYSQSAVLSELLLIERGPARREPATCEQALQTLLRLSDRDEGFAPYSLLAGQLRQWHGEDWLEKERAIIAQALENCQIGRVVSPNEQWWHDLVPLGAR